MKKLLLLIITLALVLSAAACSNGGGKDKTTTGIKPPVTSDSGKENVDPLPTDKNYKGSDFRISMTSGMNGEFFIEEDSTDPVKSALWRRNATVQDRFNIVIKPIYSTYVNGDLYSQANDIMRNVLLDKDAYDLTSTMVVASGGLVTSGCLYDWSTLPYSFLDRSWWIDSINKEFTIDGHIYTAVGHTCITALKWTYAMMFNRSKGDEYRITDGVFEAIDEGDWTIDYFNALVSTIYEDIDGVNGRSEEDFFGFNAESLTNLDNFNFAFGLRMIESDPDTVLGFAYNTERTSAAIDKVLDLYWNNSGSFITETAGVESNNFVNNRSMFAIMRIDTCFTGLRDMTDAYAILPFPKFDTTQEKYLTGMMDNYSVLGVPTSAHDPEYSSIIAEALNMEAEKTMYPVWFEESLQNRFKNDEYTVKYLQLLFDGRTADMGVLFQQDLSRIAMMFRDVVRSKSNHFSNYWSSMEESMNTNLQMIIDKYLEKNS